MPMHMTMAARPFDPARALKAFPQARALVAFDFDGTLAPLVPDREAASMRPATAVLFAAVCARYPTAVISGRAYDDVAARLGLARPVAVIGNHGAETAPRDADGRVTPPSLMLPPVLPLAIQRARTLLQPFVGETLDLEDKRYSLSLHVRGGAAEVGAQLTRVKAALSPLGSAVRIHAGHAVINVVEAGAPDKGVALTRLVAAHEAEQVLYVGDDVTDEDVFRLRADWLTGVRIGAADATCAEYVVPSQTHVDELLAWLVHSRSHPRASSSLV